MAKSTNLDKYVSFRVNEELKMLAIRSGIKPEHYRNFIRTFNQSSKSLQRIGSGDWKNLRDILDKVPSLNLVGDVGSGKTHLVKALIKNDSSHIFIVLDAHNEYDWLPITNTITPDLTTNCRIKLPDQPDASIALFRIYYNLIMNNRFPANYILAIDESLRYKHCGIKNLLAESRKFLKCIAISQEQLVDFCPVVRVKNYVQT